MAQIKIYNQQVSPQGGYSAVQMNPDAAATQGKGLQQIGGAIQNLGEAVEYRNNLTQISSGSKDMADLRVKWTNKIKEDSMSGAAASDGYVEKVTEQYNEDFSKIAEKYDAPKASEYLNSANNELKTSVFTHSFAASSELKNVKVMEDHQAKLSSLSQAVRLDPMQYDSQKKQLQKEYDAWADMGFSSAKIEKLKYDDSRLLNFERIRGEIDSKDEKYLPGIKDAIATGKYNLEYLSGDDVGKLVNYAEAEISNRRIQREHDMALNEKAIKKMSDDTMNSLYLKFEANSLTMNDIKQSKLPNGQPLPWEYKERMKNIMAVSPRKELKANDSAYSRQLFADIVDGKVTGGEEIEQSFIDGKISKESMNFLTKQLDTWNQPSYAPYKQDMKSLKSYVRARLVNDAAGLKDPEGERIEDLFWKDNGPKIKQLLDSGVPASEIFDPSMKSPNSMYGVTLRYMRTMQEKMDSTIQSLNPPKTDIKYKSIDDYESGKAKE